MRGSTPYATNWVPYLLVAPQLAVTIIFFIWPAGQALWQSLLQQDAFGQSTTFVGIDNFTALFTDPLYLKSFKVTVVFSLLVSVTGLAVALFFAALADYVVKGSAVYRTLLIWPYAIAPVVAAVLWTFLLNPSLGVITHWLRAFGYTWDHMINSGQALTLVVVASVWKQISYNFVFFFAALQSIPKSLIEAAAIDGAGPVRRFFSIVFPLISPTSFFLLVVNIVYAFFDTFAIIDASTSGGPAKATEILVYKVFQDGFKGLDLGGSAAQSVVLMVIVIALTVIQFRYVERKVNY